MGPRLVKGASVADFATHLGGFGTHGAAISAGLGSLCRGRGPETGPRDSSNVPWQGKGKMIKFEAKINRKIQWVERRRQRFYLVIYEVFVGGGASD